MQIAILAERNARIFSAVLIFFALYSLGVTEIRAIPEPLSVCSFNIFRLGHISKIDEGLASLVKHCDITLIQELVSSPLDLCILGETVAFHSRNNCSGIFVPKDKNGEATRFHNAMLESNQYLKFIISPGGTGNNVSTNSLFNEDPGTEWFLAYFDRRKVREAKYLRRGYLEKDRSSGKNFDRVPFAFGFETFDREFDFILISVHLHHDGHDVLTPRDRRKQELTSIKMWIDGYGGDEEDFIIAGDFNFEPNECEDEEDFIEGNGWTNVNHDCLGTNFEMMKPFDNFLIQSNSSVMANGFEVIEMIDPLCNNYWMNTNSTCPKNDVESFREYFSDHHPVRLQIALDLSD